MEFSDPVKIKFPEIKVVVTTIKGVNVRPEVDELKEQQQKLIEKISEEYLIENLADEDNIRAYRDFFWKVGVDPTKLRPASEALIRKILNQSSIISINSVVDSYNMASIENEITLGAYDLDKINGDIIFRFAEEGEAFLGIGMSEPKIMTGKEVVVADSEKIVAIYPYRDSEATKIDLETSNIILIGYGVPGILLKDIEKAVNSAKEYIIKYANGEEVDNIIID